MWFPVVSHILSTQYPHEACGYHVRQRRQKTLSSLQKALLDGAGLDQHVSNVKLQRNDVG